MTSWFRGNFARVLPLALVLGACRGLGPPIFASSDAGRRAEASPAVAPNDAAEPVEPLRDARERHLLNVRQLTHGKSVGSPRFTGDGKGILFLSRNEQSVVLDRVSPQGGAPEEVTLGLPRGSPWSLIDGLGGPCLVLTPLACSLEPWPDPLGLVSCRSLAQIPTAAGVSCPSQPDNALPCVENGHGGRACSVPTDHGATISLTLKPGGTPVILGPRDGLSFAPAFSADGQRLLFLSQSDGAVRLWVAATAHPDLAQAMGPETRRIVDPIFTPTGNAVIFASSVDDTGGQELDLDLLRLDSQALERVTFEPGADRFPAFSPDERFLTWVSDRNADPGTSDLFIASWVATPK